MGSFHYSNQFFLVFILIEEINRRFCLWVIEQGKEYTLRDTAIIYDDMIKMANLSIVGVIM